MSYEKEHPKTMRRLTRDRVVAYFQRRRARGPFYRFSHYRRMPNVRPSRGSTYANKWRRRIDSRRQHKQLLEIIGPGTLSGDIFAATRGDAEAAERLAQRLWKTWNIRKPKTVLDALKEQATFENKSISTLKREWLIRGIVHVLQRRNEQQRVRISTGFIKDEDDTPMVAVPNDRTTQWLLKWLSLEAPKAATAAVLGRPYPASGKRKGEALDRKDVADLAGIIVQSSDDVLTAVLHDETHREQSEFLQSALDLATDRERPFVEAWCNSDSIADMARALGETSNNCRQLVDRWKRRVRQKLERPSA